MKSLGTKAGNTRDGSGSPGKLSGASMTPLKAFTRVPWICRVITSPLRSVFGAGGFAGLRPAG
ncbi:hypothetical protein, partial [Acidithiobacillus ferriphilus]|uniref:hypothetical protein n=1 Tax=Acidithiobacillus ferriphilus TaxID=1689834 RepID=UPI002DBB6ECF